MIVCDSVCGNEGLRTSPPPFVALLELAATVLVTEPGDAVEKVGGHCLVLLLDEAEGRKGEAGQVAVAVLDYSGHQVFGARHKQVKEGRVGGISRYGGIASVQEHEVLGSQVGGADLNVDVGSQLDSQTWYEHRLGVVCIAEKLHLQCADKATVVVLHCDGGG